MSQITKEDVKELIAPLKEDIAQVLDHLRDQNGRLRTAETDIAILKDRQPGRSAMWWGASSGGFFGIMGIILEYFRHNK